MKQPRSRFIFIQTQNGLKYFIDAVFDVNYSQSGSPSKYYMESGTNVSDHYSQSPDEVSISGRTSNIKIIGGESESTSMTDLVRGLTQLKQSGKPFTVSFSDVLNPLDNCLFNNLSLSYNDSTGVHAVDIEISITQILTAKQAIIVKTPVPMNQYADVVAMKEINKGNSTEPTTIEKKKLATIVKELDSDVYRMSGLNNFETDNVKNTRT